MTVSNIEIYNKYYLKSPDFLHRFEGSVLKWMDSILAEAANAPDHANRVRLADLILDDTKRQRLVQMMMPYVANNGTYQTEGEAIEDTTIDWFVSTYLLENPVFVAGAISALE